MCRPAKGDAGRLAGSRGGNQDLWPLIRCELLLPRIRRDVWAKCQTVDFRRIHSACSFVLIYRNVKNDYCMTPRVGLRRAPLGVGLLSVFGFQSVRVAGQCLRYVPADSRERHEKNDGVVESESTTGPSLSLLFDSTCRTKASLQMCFVERHERNDAEEVRNLSTTLRQCAVKGALT